jgi:hypothetical protein
VIQCPNNLYTPTAESQNVQRTQASQNPTLAEWKCYACGERGHYANQCPNPCVRPPQIVAPTPAFTRRANSIPFATKQNYAHGRVNHVTVEEAQEAPDIIIDMFFINNTSTVVLFDYGASHPFISATYIGKHNLPLAMLKCQMIVSSPGGDMSVRQLCPKVNLKIRGKILSPTSMS